MIRRLLGQLRSEEGRSTVSKIGGKKKAPSAANAKIQRGSEETARGQWSTFYTMIDAVREGEARQKTLLHHRFDVLSEKLAQLLNLPVDGDLHGRSTL